MAHRPGVLAALALTLLPTFGTGVAQAGTLAQLQMQARSVGRAPRIDLCVGGARTLACRAALESALHTQAQALAFKGRADTMPQAYAAAKVSPAFEAREPLPLKFNTDPEWKKRAIVMAHEGLTFLRMPQGASHEFLIGINRQGRLGFSLKDTTGE
jgi:hypothetical protein